MKHCPDPDCHGLENFGIVSEYEDHVTACADCGAELVPGPAPEPDALEDRPEPDPDAVLVSLVRLRDATVLTVLRSRLEDAGIPYLAEGAGIQDLFGFGRLVAVNPITGPVEIRVNEHDLAAARELLGDIED